jgi:hypothetical protein
MRVIIAIGALLLLTIRSVDAKECKHYAFTKPATGDAFLDSLSHDAASKEECQAFRDNVEGALKREIEKTTVSNGRVFPAHWTRPPATAAKTSWMGSNNWRNWPENAEIRRGLPSVGSVPARAWSMVRARASGATASRV